MILKGNFWSQYCINSNVLPPHFKPPTKAQEMRERNALPERVPLLAFTVVSLHATLKIHTYILRSAARAAKTENQHEVWASALFLFFIAGNCCWSSYVLRHSGELSQWEAFNNSQNKKYIFCSYILCEVLSTHNANLAKSSRVVVQPSMKSVIIARSLQEIVKK